MSKGRVLAVASIYRDLASLQAELAMEQGVMRWARVGTHYDTWNPLRVNVRVLGATHIATVLYDDFAAEIPLKRSMWLIGR
jgi:hypothetical protein